MVAKAKVGETREHKTPKPPGQRFELMGKAKPDAAAKPPKSAKP